MPEKRYYYKHKQGKGFLNFKSPLEQHDDFPKEEIANYEEITEAEFVELTKVEEESEN